MDKYFVYCSESGYETFETPEAAEREANDRLDSERDHAAEGWRDNASTIVWGEIKAVSTECDVKAVTEEDRSRYGLSNDIEYKCDYQLKAV